MRRRDKEIIERSAIEGIIKRSKACRLAMIHGDKPYIVPLCFGYRDNVLYFHGSLNGHKIDLIRKNPNVCFEFDLITEPIEGESACSWSMKYQSVVGFGKAAFLEHMDDKIEALNIIMSQYSDRAHRFPENKLEATAVFKVEIESMTGKQSGF
jgi:nitroimidazol reductase NimA-like FMN-containing flavoprotein (pyridoxamine 5'-phosphate oxidase superfamily)